MFVPMRRAVASPARVSFVQYRDNMYNRPFPMHTWKMAVGGEDVAATPWQITRPVRFLERQTFPEGAIEGPDGKEAATASAGRSLKTYSPEWKDEPLFSKASSRDMRLTVEPTGELASRGFQAPEFPAELKKKEIAWYVTAHVVVGENGRVEQVFLDGGSESKEINSLVIKTLYKGSVSKPGGQCEGSVRVNFGQE